MPQTLGDFHSLVRETLNRGTALDAVFPARVRMAAMFLERNIDFQYMRRWLQFTVDVTVDKPYLVSLLGLRPKGIDAVRITNSQETGRYKDLGKVSPKDRSTLQAGEINGYWLDGLSNLVFDAIPEEDFTGEMHVRQFTDWATQSSWTHWLIDNAEDLLLAQTCMLMAIRLKDQRMFEMYKLQRDDSMTTLSISQEEIEGANSDPTMVWMPPNNGNMTSADTLSDEWR